MFTMDAMGNGRPPLIGLTVGSSLASDGQEYVRLRTTYIRAVEAAGGLPVLVPPLSDHDALVALLERLYRVPGPDLATGGAIPS